MSEQERAWTGWSVRRQFERSRLEGELFEAIYEALMAAGSGAATTDSTGQTDALRSSQRATVAA
jgi:hypothetical protein